MTENVSLRMRKMEKKLLTLKSQPTKEAGKLISFLMRLNYFERACVLSDSFFEAEIVHIYFRLEELHPILANDFRRRLENLLGEYNYIISQCFRYVLLKLDEGPDAYQEYKNNNNNG
ncbi:MAG: hypothetical protein QG648_365 [Patescibacteria group bacterium]|nr:hypothetical protein [Patescibacteria group bacterium]